MIILPKISPSVLAVTVLEWMLLTVPLRAADPFSFETTPGRLPKDVVPLEYELAIVPDAKALSISGTESVRLEFRKPTDTIQFNSLNEKLSDVTLDGEPVKSVVSDDTAELTTVTLERPARTGRHTLRFNYTGVIETKPQGLFAQPFVKSGGGEDVLLSTQFEATNARRMFPCWDEPAFRATYTLTVTVPSEWSAVSNMPIAHEARHGATTTTTFQPSPKMPSYLVEFTAGDLARITDRVGQTEIGVWTVRGQEENGRTALANAKLILADYNEYFGATFPLPKLDSIAVPGGISGAMENWGAITYNDQRLLITPAATLEQKQGVFSIQAHEMAHQWNGDLVTMGWWDDLWLNESFASWRAAKETDLRHPSWKWWEVQDAARESAMAADGQPNSHAIYQHVTNEVQAASAFDPQITYNKGQAVLRMIEAYLGPDTFRDGIRGYMKAHAYSNANGADLWNALSKASGQNVGDIVSGWIQQPGFPVISVTASRSPDGRRTIALAQKRFLLQGNDPANLHWTVPLQIRSGTNTPPQSVLLTKDGQTIGAGKDDEPLSVNAGAIGYYRVLYDEPTLQRNTKAFGSLSDADRIALLDDQWALVQAGAQKLPAYLALASAMGSHLNERAWDQITGALGVIEYAERGSPGHDAFTAYARTIIRPVADRLGWDSSPDEAPGIQKLRRTVLRDLGEWGDAQMVSEARKRFAAFVNDRKAISPDDQEMILAIVARNADDATFKQLHQNAKSAQEETELRRFYSALMLVRDPKLAEQAVAIALSDEIPIQAAALRVGLVAAISEWHPGLGWNTLTANLDMLLKPFGSFAPLMLAQYVPLGYWNAVPLDQIETWVKAHVPAEMAPELARGMEAARFQVALKKVLVPATDNYLQTLSTQGATFDSPRLTALAKEIKTGNHAAADWFFEELKGKAPLVETMKDDEQRLWVTLVYRGDAATKRAGMFGGLPTGNGLSIKPLARFLDTDLWFCTEKLPKDSRYIYTLFVDYQQPPPGELGYEELMKQMRRDPLNPKTFVYPPNSSVVELAAAPPQPWLERLPDVPEGKYTREIIKSEILNEERKIRIYTPPGYDPKGEPNGLLVLFDGEAFPKAVPAPAILDNLISKGKISPMMAVMIDSQKTRDRDLACSPNFADFVAKELVPWLRARYPIRTDPSQTIISGFSYGGLAATYVGLRHSEVFGNVLSQSGSFWYFEKYTVGRDNSLFIDSGWLTRQFVSSPRLPLRFYLEVGQFEQDILYNMVIENRRMRDVLLAKGYEVTYSEYNGGHDMVCWRSSLADGLIALAGKGVKK